MPGRGFESLSHHHISKKLYALHGHGLIERNGRYPFIQVISLLTWVNYPYLIQPEVIERYAHGRCYRWGVATLYLNAHASRSTQHQKINFRTLVGGPEIRLIRLNRLKQLLNNEALP